MVDRYYADDPDDIYYAKDGKWVEFEDYEEIHSLLGEAMGIIARTKLIVDEVYYSDREKLLTKIDKAIGK